MRIVDLFSGAGGLTFGFYYKLIGGKFLKNEKNHFVFANEFDKSAAAAFKTNFPDIENLIIGDIKNIKSETVIKLIGTKEVDLIIGGPPCQSFSTVGKRVYDDKAKLYEEYLKKLAVIKPKMFLFENVKGILSMKETFYKTDKKGQIEYIEEKNKNDGKLRKKPLVIDYGKNILEKIKEQFSKINENLGYKIYTKVLNAQDYGVPQSRERVFIIGIRNDCNITWAYPKAICGEGLQEFITLEQAIGDFADTDSNRQPKKYLTRPQNKYQKLMQCQETSVTQHFVATHGRKLTTIIPKVPCGEGKNYINMLVEKGELPEFCKLTSGYNNTYGRLVPDKPCTTITNNMTTPSALRCIHYRFNRTISPREGARIQSFPDWFNFVGGLTQVTTQIGNAVPPLLAIALAEQIENILGGMDEQGNTI